MVKKNYSAWQINATSFREDWSDIKKLEFFARYAVLAPSGHNTQPWQLFAAKDSIFVSINPDHYLSIDGSGLLSVEPCISIGTFLEVFSMAGQGFGYEIAVDLLPDQQHIAEIKIAKKAPAEPRLLEAIINRVSNRNAYEETAIAAKLLNTATTINKLTGVKATVITKRSDIDFIASQTELAIQSIMGNPAYRQELSLWVRTNQTRKFDGMPGFTHGFGNVKALISKTAVRHAPKHGPQAKKSGDLIRNSGALVIVRCSNEEKESFINAGRLYSQICVHAQKEGFATSALGASVLDGATREKVKKRFKINDRPIYVIRIGKAKVSAKHSPRWPLEKILSHEAR